MPKAMQWHVYVNASGLYELSTRDLHQAQLGIRTGS